MKNTSSQKVKSISENGTQTVYQFLSSRIFSFLILCYIFFPIFIVLTFMISKTTSIFIEFLKNNSSFATITDPSNIILYCILLIPVVVLLYMPLFVMKSIYNHAFRRSSVEIISKKITLLSIIVIFLSFVLLFIYMLISNISNFLGDVLFSTMVNWSKIVIVPWNIKILILGATMLSGIAISVMLIVLMLSIDKSLRTDKIYIKGTSATNFMAIVNIVAFLILFVIMLIEQDWIFCLFCIVGIAFDVLLICNIMHYLRIANYSLSTQYNEYIIDIHKEENITYYDKFTEEEVDSEKLFSQENEEYVFDASSKPFDFYSGSKEFEQELNLESSHNKENRIIGTCPICGKLMHDEQQCPFCGYFMKPTADDE